MIRLRKKTFSWSEARECRTMVSGDKKSQAAVSQRVHNLFSFSKPFFVSCSLFF